MRTLDDLGPDERLLTANRLICVLEQLLARAAGDAEGRPFAGLDIADFCQATSTVLRIVEDLLRDLPTGPGEP